MTREEALKLLEDIKESGDPEIAHHEADRILLQFLNDNGFADIANAFTNAEKIVGFWYA